MGRNRICEICGVRERHRPGFFANFPIDEQRCRTWVQIVGKEDLVHVPIEKLHEIRFICGDHFKARDLNKKGNRVKKRAYPKLHLSAPPLTDYQLKDFPLHVASKSVPAPTPMAEEVPPAPVASSSKTPLVADTTQNIMESPTGGFQLRDRWDHTYARTDFPPEQESPTGGFQLRDHWDHTYARTDLPSEQVPAPTPMEEEVPAAPIVSSSKTPLATSTTQNIMVPASTPMTEDVPPAPVASSTKTPLATANTPNIMIPAPTPIEKEVLPTPVASSSKTPLDVGTTKHIMDWDKSKAKLLRQLKQIKATVKSLRRNANLLERLDSPMVKEIVTLALKNQKRKPRGRRWTKKYKISCLAILKRSPKAYRYLGHLVPLPSIKTLQNLLKKVPMDTGISPQVLEHLRKIAKSYGNDKCCCLLFDEMSLKPRLNYNIGNDRVDGYTDMGKNERTKDLADHALVFMLQGIKKNFKQPLAFYFVKGTVSSAKLATIIKEIITAVNDTGFKVMATVCDQGPTNMGALKILKDLSLSPSEHGPQIKNYFNVNGSKTYIIFDVPHLFKSVRNNLLNYGSLIINGMRVKWDHLLRVEERNRNLLYLSKISENHVRPKYRAKMKVKYAAQALSRTVSAVLKLLALAATDPLERQELHESGEVIHDLDLLFDITNGPSGPNEVKKGQRENVSNKTKHLQLWAEYRKRMETLTFAKPDGTQAKNVRCVQGYLMTLCTFRDLWIDLQRLGFKYLNLRQLNQDALENFFGVLRQHSPTNRNPTVSGFVAALKTSIISGMSAPHGRGSNCEKDNCVLLTDLQDFVFGQEYQSSIEENEDIAMNKENVQDDTGVLLSIPEENENLESNLLNVEGQAVIYVSGYIAMRAAKLNNCVRCKESLLTRNLDNNPAYNYIKLREWWTDKASLTYPNMQLCIYIEQCLGVFENDVIQILHEKHITQLAVTLFMTIDSSFLKCEQHRSTMVHEISSRLATLLVRRQCKRINDKIAAQEEIIADKNKKAQQQGIAK